MTKVAAGITHSGTAGATAGLAISSTTGFVTIAAASSGTSQYVKVEDVRFAGADIGIDADPDLIGLANQAVTVTGSVTATGDLTVGTSAFTVTASNGNTAVTGTLGVTDITTLAEDLKLSEAVGKLTHTGATGFDISSTTGYVTINGGSTSAFVDVESVRFTGAAIGVSGDPDIITLSTSGAVMSTKLSVAGAHSDASKELYVNGDIYATGTSTAASDSRYKRDVEPIGGGLEIARALRPVTFNFRTEEFTDKKFPETLQAGVIAQEMETVLPHLVSSDDAGFKGVAYERLGVYALAGVKELDAKVDADSAAREEKLAAQEEKIAVQEAKLAALEEQVKSLVAAVEALKSHQAGGGDASGASATS